MGIGMALSEKLLVDSNYGSLLNANLMKYRLPTQLSVPRIDVFFAEKNLDPFGPKSLGEIGIVPVPAAIGNAIFNATTVRLRSLPFTHENFLDAFAKLE